MQDAALHSLLDFHAPLSTFQRTDGDAVTLLTPGTNVLGLNCTYLPAGAQEPAALRDWLSAHEAPLLRASTAASAGPLVTALRVGRLRGARPAPGVVVEQVSRLHLPAWSRVLVDAHGTPGWDALLARHLAAALEREQGYGLLLAYRDGQEVGALLSRARGQGGAAHLWGALAPEVEGSLLQAAAEVVAGPLWVSCGPDGRTALDEEVVVKFSFGEA